MARDVAIIVAAFAIATALAAAFGAANFGTALAFGQIGFAVALVWVLLRETDMSQIRGAASGIGSVLEDQVRRWWAYTGATENHLHDPVAILPALRPELFRFEQCDVHVAVEGADPGRTSVGECGTGAVRVAADVDASAAEQEIVRRLAGQ